MAQARETAATPDPRPLWRRLGAGPLDGADGRSTNRLADLIQDGRAAGVADTALAVIAEPAVAPLLSGIMAGSPYLAGLCRRDPDRLARLFSASPEASAAARLDRMDAEIAAAMSDAAVMAALRTAKAEMALLIALADLGGVWPVETVTGMLTETADRAVRAAVGYLFAKARARGDWTAGARPHDPGAGFIVLGLGKFGARELNYSSDIDIVVFYDPDAAALRGGLEPQFFFVRLTRDLVRLLQERTGDGYVFRTDLRLRPDPGATQIALSTTAAFDYYESVGQNWERAALIKARPVAGDLAAGAKFLADLAPFIWRKYLDYAAIADIHAMKRQIHAYRGFGTVRVAGHNIKLGRGGIREIEFFAQTQQLIAGGRQPDLRVPTTCGALASLAARGWIAPAVGGALTQAYRHLRGIEHRLQMVADEQTQELPSEPDTLASFARFAGYAGTPELAADLTEHLRTVERHYAALFESSPALTRDGLNMVFAGESDDPATMAALARLGYADPSRAIATVRGWHHGRARAVRSPRARERLTEVQPLLIEALADTADPDAAIAAFDRFVTDLPSGVQLFSLLKANPGLMQLMAGIMGQAPRLARVLSRQRRLLDAVLDPRVIGTLPAPDDLQLLVGAELDAATDLQDALDRARVVGTEQAFLVAVRMLTGLISPREAGPAYAAIAEAMISGLAERVAAEFMAAHGTVPGGGWVIVAMGKLGGREMTAASDLDLIVVYDSADGGSLSDGPRPLPASQYHARLTQRLISALTAPTAEGRLYDVDLRLRPSGQKGPLATRLESFLDYQRSEAWTWEHMALTRARVIWGPEPLRARVEAAIASVLIAPRDRAKIASDVREMRARIARDKPGQELWDLKHAPGGLVDIEFIAQFLQLVTAATVPAVVEQTTSVALSRLTEAGALPLGDSETLAAATALCNDLTQVMRLCLDGPFDPATAPDGLKRLLSKTAAEPSFSALEARLAEAKAAVVEAYDRLVV